VGETVIATRTSATRSTVLAAIRMPGLNHLLLPPQSAAPPEHRESAAEPGLAGGAMSSVDGSFKGIDAEPK